MRDVLADIDSWLDKGTGRIALATVVQTWGSSPRKAGAKMAMAEAGQISGSVSGGCVEGAVYDSGLEILNGDPARLLHFGVADETAWDVGLACGGTIEVFVQCLDLANYQLLRELLQADVPAFSATIIKGSEDRLGQSLTVADDGRRIGTFGPELDTLALEAAQGLHRSGRVQLTDSIELFVDVLRPAPSLVMVGGVHIATALTGLAKVLGFHTIVIDPRRGFGSQERFPNVDQLIQEWPDKAFSQIQLTPETAVAMLTHDPKIDDPALKIVLKSPAYYIGALGSRKTHARRCQRLQEMGFSQAELDRIHGPIGLSIGASTPEEIALSIMAEVVKARNALSAK